MGSDTVERFRLEVSDDAWAALARLPAELRRRVFGRVELLAGAAASAADASDERSETTVQEDGVVVRVVLDRAGGLLSVREVALSGGAPEGATS